MVKKDESTVEMGAVCSDPGAIEGPLLVHDVSDSLLKWRISPVQAEQRGNTHRSRKAGLRVLRDEKNLPGRGSGASETRREGYR